MGGYGNLTSAHAGAKLNLMAYPGGRITTLPLRVSGGGKTVNATMMRPCAYTHPLPVGPATFPWGPVAPPSEKRVALARKNGRAEASGTFRGLTVIPP